MDDDLKKSCPSCSQLYSLQLTSSKVKGNLPLFLPCGHTTCENCIVNIMKCLEPIECKICFRDADIKGADPNELVLNKTMLYQKFPVNFQMVGELTMNLMKTPGATKKTEEDAFIDLKSLMKSDAAQGHCLECNITTSKMCKECVTILCEACFNKPHKNFVMFKNHVLQSIEGNMQWSTCKLHIGKPLDYYCNDCKKPVCTDCMMLGGEKSCKNHDVVSLQEVNAMFLDELTNIAPQVDETFRRLTNTAVDIGYLLYNYDDTGAVKELFKIIDSVEQHFSKLFSIIQKHKDDILNIILYLEFSEKNALQKAKSEVANSIKKAKNVLKMITLATENKNIKQMNLPALLEDAKQVANTPWFLNKTEASKRTLKVTVNEDLCSLVSDYVHLEGNVKTVYKLHSTSELDVEVPPAPPNPVYPPELPKDGQSKPKVEKEIQKPPTLYKRAPKYRSKIGSEMISLNSNCSNNSNRSYISLNSYQQQPIIQPVSPFLENQLHPSPLSEGAQELIYISHIVDPSNFFVQRACNQGLVKDMVREFRNAVSFAKPSQNHITPGKSYLVFDKAGNMWQRCRVLSIDMKKSDPIVQVFCFDFGNIEFVTLDKLRLLPPSKIQCPDPLAINCSLFNCVPKTGNWTYEDAFLIHNIIDNKQAVIHIRRIIPLSNVDFKLECDMNTFEHGISIAHALVFHDRAKMPYPRLRYPAIHGIKEKLKLYTNNNETYSENLEPVYLTHVISPDKFYVRKLHLQKAFEKLTEDLEQEYSLASNVGTVYLPEKGMVCAVNLERCRLETLGSWARGVVLERVGRGRVRVWLPDVGLTLLLHWCSLRYIHPKFTTVSALSTECYLAGVTPFNKKWSAASVELLQKFMGYTLELQVEDNRNRFHRSHGSIGVTLYYKPDSDTVICINNEMVKHNFAVSFGIYTFNKTPVEEQVLTNKSPLEKPSPPAPSKPKIKILKRNMPMDVINDDDLLAKDKDPVRLEVKILNCQSPSLIYVSFMLQQNNFKNMFEEMQKYYSKNTENKTKKDWQVGDRCATLCIQSQTWRRAVIMELENDNAKVVYSDFAFIETVPKSSLREIISEFTNYGDAAIKCHLFGIKPARGEEWPIITKDFLKELIDASKSFFVTKVGNFKDNSMPIELWVYHTEQGGALEPNKSSWHCVNQRILSQGLCVADKTQVVTSEHKTDNTEDTLSFLNITGSVNEWLQLEPMPMAPLNTGKPDEDIITASSSLSIVEDEDYKSFPRDGRESSNIMYITDWLPPEPLSCKEFTSMPTHIDNDGIIYLHDVCQQDSLDLIRKVLDLNPKALDPDPKAKFTKWSVGEPCVALYYLDNRYYRGRVVEVNKENSSCIIHYIDFGNEETCSFKNLRKSVPLHQIPTQAHKCMLNRIRPLGKQWDRNILDYIHKCIVEKKCYTKVTGEPVNGIVPIDIEYDKLWINDHLVKFEMAEYTDGSKALVRKYAPVEKINEEDDVIESDSGPDDIVVDDADTTTEQLSPTSTSDSSDISSLEGLEADWNTLIDQEESSFDEHYFTYTRHMDDEFSCNITIINDLNTLQLSLIFDDDITRMYEKMFEELQTESMNMPHLNGIFENKACVAIFPEDNLWYRASILQFCEKTNKVKVRYVDYGNISVIYLADIREIDEEWAKLPPATITAKLFGVRLNPDVDITEIKKEYTELFLGKGPFHVKVVSYDDSVPLVEMKNEEQELVYKNLIENNMLIPSV